MIHQYSRLADVGAAGFPGPACDPVQCEDVPVARGHLVDLDVVALATDHVWLQAPDSQNSSQ